MVILYFDFRFTVNEQQPGKRYKGTFVAIWLIYFLFEFEKIYYFLESIRVSDAKLDCLGNLSQFVCDFSLDKFVILCEVFEKGDHIFNFIKRFYDLTQRDSKSPNFFSFQIEDVLWFLSNHVWAFEHVIESMSIEETVAV